MLYLYPFIIASVIFINGIEARWKPTQDMTWNIILGSKVNLYVYSYSYIYIFIKKLKTFRKLFLLFFFSRYNINI